MARSGHCRTRGTTHAGACPTAPTPSSTSVQVDDLERLADSYLLGRAEAAELQAKLVGQPLREESAPG
jgi:hypothetical protein